jgi:hypothetical protein
VVIHHRRVRELRAERLDLDAVPQLVRFAHHRHGHEKAADGGAIVACGDQVDDDPAAMLLAE